MKKYRYSEIRMASILKQAKAGIPVTKVCCEHDISVGTFYKWRQLIRNKDAALLDLRPEEAAEIRERVRGKHDCRQVKGTTNGREPREAGETTEAVSGGYEA